MMSGKEYSYFSAISKTVNRSATTKIGQGVSMSEKARSEACYCLPAALLSLDFLGELVV